MSETTATDAAANRPASVRESPVSPPRSTRAETTARTRRAILDAATRLFVERGFGAVSVRDIAAEAGLSHPGVLRHFASKDVILLAVVEEFTAQTMAWAETHEIAVDAFADLARQNAAIPGYLPLFTTLAGEATSQDHPAHAYFRDRHVNLGVQSGGLFRTAIARGELPDDLDPHDEALRLAAAWDGLQLISLYLPDRVDIPGMIEAHLGRLRGIRPPVSAGAASATAAAAAAAAAAATAAAEPNGPIIFTAPAPDDSGYAPGRARRAQIVEDATTLFASRGFHATTLQEIADRVGIGKSTLLHHFANKEDLLGAVVARRDVLIESRTSFDPTLDAASMLAEIPGRARLDAVEEPGLIELYAVLSAEAAAPGHAGHDYFARRFESAIAGFSELLRRAASARGIAIDAEFEAIWFIALWDGLQLQWLYDPEAVSVGDHLEAHLARIAR